MEEAANTIKKLVKRIGKSLKAVLPITLVATLIFVLVAGFSYIILKWIAESVNNTASEFTSSVSINTDGTATTNISAKELWNQMIEAGYDVDKYLKSPQELERLLNAEIVTQLPDTRSNVEKEINWDAIFKTNKDAKNTKINVLFIGNSKTYVNELPTQFQELAKSLGKEVYAVRTTGAWGGRTLNSFLDEDEPSQDFKNRVKETKWDYVVLQEQTDASLDSDQLVEGATRVIDYVKENSNKNVIPIYDAWSVLSDYNQVEYSQATRNYETARYQNGGKVAYIAKALLECHSKYPSMNLFYDDRHPTTEGTYLAACCTYKAIYGEDTEGASFKFGLSDETATNIQKVVDEVQKNNVEGIIKFKRHDADGSVHYLTYVEPEEFYAWQDEYNITSDNDSRQNALDNIMNHYTLVKKATSPSATANVSLQAAENDVVTDISEKIIQAANNTPWSGEQMCLNWVDNVYENAGVTPDRLGTARIAGKAHIISTDKTKIPIGAAVYGEGSGEPGHVGIYIGNGKVKHNTDNGLREESLDDFLAWQSKGNPGSWIGWGWEDGNKTRGTTEDTKLKKNTDESKSSKDSKKDSASKVQSGFTQIYPDINQTGYAQTYTSSTGRTYKDFKQIAPAPYSGQPYNGSTIGSYGCGITSAAIILSSFAGCEDIDPSVTGSQMRYTSDTDFFASRGISAQSIEGGCSAEEIANLLKEGKVLVAGYRGNPAICRKSALCCYCRYGFKWKLYGIKSWIHNGR